MQTVAFKLALILNADKNNTLCASIAWLDSCLVLQENGNHTNTGDTLSLILPCEHHLPRVIGLQDTSPLLHLYLVLST